MKYFTLAVAGILATSLLAACGKSSDTSQATKPAPAAPPDTAAASLPTERASNDAMNGITRVKTPEGGLLVTATKLPRELRDPHDQPDFATGDWIVGNLGSEPSIITPLLEKDDYGAHIQYPVLETLLARDQDTFEWDPWLAESFEQKADGVTVVYKLRQQATFSDGTPVTADDVLFSYNTTIDKDIDDDRYKAGADRIESCTKIDDRTIAFKFKEPYFQELEVSGSGFAIIPKHIYAYTTAAEYNKRTDLLVGSGPYTLEKGQWQRGQRIILTRNEKYWGPKAPADRLVYVFIQNPQAAFQAFQAGDIDSFPPDSEVFTKYSKDESFTSKYTVFKYDRPNSGYGFIGWNEKKPMFADVKTRTALTMLVDRNTMIETILFNLARPISGPFSFMTPQSDPSIKPLPFDPRAARALLTEAGWKLNAQNILVRDGVEFRFDLMIPADTPQYVKVCEIIKSQFAKAGIILTIAPYEFSVMVDHLDNRNFDAAMLAWTAQIEDDPYQIWHSDSIKNKGSNFISWSNPEGDKLIESARRELNEAKRMEIWHKFHKLLADEQPYTFLWISMSRDFIQPRIKNTQPHKLGLDNFFADWYVPAGHQKYK